MQFVTFALVIDSKKKNKIIRFKNKFMLETCILLHHMCNLHEYPSDVNRIRERSEVTRIN